MAYYLAIDLGASSGRHMLARLDGGKIVYEEVHRFGNDFKEQGGVYCWDLEYLFNEIKAGLKKCAKIGKPPSYIGIDSWGVDYVLLDEKGRLIGDAVSYRDDRTKGIEKKVFGLIPEEELFTATGVQSQAYNTIFQLYAHKLKSPNDLKEARSLLMLPCYFNYLLTGELYNEYTIASTSGLLGAKSGDWDDFVIEKLGFNRGIFKDIKAAGTILGGLRREIAEEIGYAATVVLPAAHDTASAVLAAPVSDNAAFLSSGTWSLMGAQTGEPILSREARLGGFTNEGCYGGGSRVLRNIMGLWMLRSVRQNFGSRLSYDALGKMARERIDFPSVVDVSDNRFLAPKNMANEIKAACAETGQPVPQSEGEICAVIYKSLALCYGKTAADLQSLTGKEIDTICIVGGGSRDKYLNSLTAEISNRKVLIGPTEASALGNISAQMLTSGEIESEERAREIILESGD